jgi:hypothetical protein
MVMQIERKTISEQTTQGQTRRERVLDLLNQMQQWPYWNEVYLNCVKESPLSYDAFAAAVRAGDASPQAYDDALRLSQMTEKEFRIYLPEFQRFMALYKEYAPLGMLSDRVDQIWHAFMLVSSRYREFCMTFFGYPIDHLPCSLYPLYGVDVPQSSCLGKCVPSSCRGNGGGCQKLTEESPTKESIIASTQSFIDAYTEAFGSVPDTRVWNQLVNN